MHEVAYAREPGESLRAALTPWRAPPPRCCAPSSRTRCRGTVKWPTSRAGRAVRADGRSLAARSCVRPSFVLFDPQFEPRETRAGASPRGAATTFRVRVPRPARSPRVSPTSRWSRSRRPRRRPTPPAPRSSSPRTVHANGNEYQPRSPPMPSMTRHNCSGDASTALAAFVHEQAAAGPVGVGRQRIAGRTGVRGGRPPRRDVRLTDPFQCEFDGAVETDEAFRWIGDVLRRCRARRRRPHCATTRRAAARGTREPASRARPSDSTATARARGPAR